MELSEWASQGDWRLYFVHRDRIEKVTAADVSKAAARYLKPDNATVGLFFPTKTPDRSVVPVVADLKKTIGNYKGRDDIARGEAFDVSPENIDARTKTITLPSGVKAAFLEKRTRGREVQFRLNLHYGDAGGLNGLATSCRLLPDLMLRGTKTMSRQQIQDELDRLKANLHVQGEAGQATFVIQTRRETLGDVLKLLGKILREPTLSENELDLLKRAELTDLENALTEPQDLALNAVRRHLAPFQKGDPRYVATIPESIEMLKAVTVDDLHKLYSQFLGGTHGELAIVGDFDEARTVPLLNAILADWKVAPALRRTSHGTSRANRRAATSRSKRPTRRTPCISPGSSSPCVTTTRTTRLWRWGFHPGRQLAVLALGRPCAREGGTVIPRDVDTRSFGQRPAHVDEPLRHLQPGQHGESPDGDRSGGGSALGQGDSPG